MRPGLRPVPAEGEAGAWPSSDTEILSGRGLLSNLGELLHSLGPASQVFLLMAQNVMPLFMDQVIASMEGAGLAFEVIPIRDGDKDKDFAQTHEIIDVLVERGAARDALAVAICHFHSARWRSLAE